MGGWVRSPIKCSNFLPKGGSINEVFINYEHHRGLSILTKNLNNISLNFATFQSTIGQDTLKPTSCFASNHDDIAHPPSSPPLLCWRLFPICHMRRHSNLIHYLATTIEMATKNTLHGRLGSAWVTWGHIVSWLLNFFQIIISKAFTRWKFTESTV